MKSNNFTPKKNAAQAIVEFAIVLPLLLLLLYGLLEVGRLLFIYSSVVTATRQAARYGATTGMGSDWTSVGGPNNSNVPRYQDCFGIRQAAQKANFLKAFVDVDIVISHDSGGGGTTYCAGTSDVSYTPSSSTTTPDRISIQITGHFTTVVPKLIPSFNRNIIASSARTILPPITIEVTAVGGGGGGGGPAATTVTITSSAATSEPGQIVTFTATVSSGSGTPTGTLTFTYSYNGGGDTAIGSCTNITLSSGVANCAIMFSDAGLYTIKATYTPTDATAFSPGAGQLAYTVGPATTTTVITSVVAEPSLINNAVTVSVTVYSAGSTSPAGTVAISASSGSCTATLSSGTGSCSLPGFSTTGWYNIGAAYTPTDATKHKPSTATPYSHEVLSSPATASNTSPPPTPITPVATTPVPTAVTGCNTLASQVSKISFSDTTMSITLKNTNDYPVTIKSVYVAWNYASGHDGGDMSLWLRQAKLGTNVFWSDNPGLNQPGAALPLSTAVIINAKSSPVLTFTFDKSYDNYSGEQIQVFFSTPGCEAYPVLLPAGAATITPAPSGNLKLQLISGGTDNTQETQFHYRVQNIGSGSVSNISVRLYFTPDGSNPASSYALVSYYDQSGTATITGPTQAGSNYYFTINYSTAALTAGSSWEFHGSLHLSGWGTTYDGSNDWWHTTSPLPSSWTDWQKLPIYVSGLVVWGGQP